MDKLSLNVTQMIDAESVILWQGDYYASVVNTDYLLMISPQNMAPMYVNYRFSWTKGVSFNVSLDPSPDLNLIKYTLKGISSITDGKARMFETDIMTFDKSIISLKTIVRHDGITLNIRSMVLQREEDKNIDEE